MNARDFGVLRQRLADLYHYTADSAAPTGRTEMWMVALAALDRIQAENERLVKGADNHLYAIRVLEREVERLREALRGFLWAADRNKRPSEHERNAARAALGEQP